jgi:lipid-A-disaccharide synthase
MVIVYRASRLTYWIGRLLVSVKNFGLVNIVAGRTVVPELLQDEATPERIAEEIGTILANPEKHRTMTEELVRVRTLLGEGGASRRAAAVVLELLAKAA